MSHIEGCPHGPAFLIPQPCEDCARERREEEARLAPLKKRLAELSAEIDAKSGGAVGDTRTPTVETITELRRARVADAEIIGRWQCQAEKAEAEVTALRAENERNAQTALDFIEQVTALRVQLQTAQQEVEHWKGTRNGQLARIALARAEKAEGERDAAHQDHEVTKLQLIAAQQSHEAAGQRVIELVAERKALRGERDAARQACRTLETQRDATIEELRSMLERDALSFDRGWVSHLLKIATGRPGDAS